MTALACSVSSGAIEPSDAEVLDGEPSDGRPFDALDDGARDSRVPDSMVRDSVADTLPAGACPSADGDAVALYTFDSETLADATGAHDGTSAAAPAFDDGPEGCGRALYLDPSTPVWMEVAHSGDFELSSGSIDFWVRIDERPATNYGLVSRDAMGDGDGHFTVFATNEGRIVARLQVLGGSTTLCSGIDVTDGGWLHVLVDFGEPEAVLYVDGRRADSTDRITLHFGPYRLDFDCGGSAPVDIAGTPNPLVVGASTAISENGTATPIADRVRGGAIDHVRISRIRRGVTP
jgi:hypothetical protein